MDRAVKSFRTKMIMLFGLSMASSGSITYVIYKGLQYYYHTSVQMGDSLARVRAIMGMIGDINCFLIIFLPLSVLFFYLLTKPYSTYFREISHGINNLARGNFQNRVEISTHDEFRVIANDINRASELLKEAIERGDFSESSKDQLVVNLAHDLRTPLTSILGYLDLILSNDQLTKDQLQHYLSIAFTKSQRLEKLIDKLFEVTRMNYGMLPLKRQHINLSDLILQLNEEMFPVFEKNQLTARLDVPPHLPIYGDGELLARVIENLLSNANRYGYDGKYIDIIGLIDGDEAVVQIINYGDSIPPDEQPRLFEMFYTGDQARTHQGTGLGLFIAKNIVEQHHGRISVDSTAIRTMFEVRLPLKTAETH